MALSVAMDSDGDFVVSWMSGFNGYYYYVPYSIYAQRYSATGVPQGVAFRVSIPANENATAPSAAMDADGDFVVAWQRGTNNYYGVFNDVYAQRYNAAGVAQGTEVRVNVATGNASAPFAAMTGDGDFVVTWQGAGISAQRFNAAGARQGVAL